MSLTFAKDDLAFAKKAQVLRLATTLVNDFL